jgi:hypothetical protein
MNTAKLELLSHKGIEQWLRKGLKQRNINHAMTNPWSEQEDATLKVSPSLSFQIGDGYYMVVSSNESVEKNLEKVAWHFEDGKGNIDKEIEKAIKAWPVGVVELRHADFSHG